MPENGTLSFYCRYLIFLYSGSVLRESLIRSRERRNAKEEWQSFGEVARGDFAGIGRVISRIRDEVNENEEAEKGTN